MKGFSLLGKGSPEVRRVIRKGVMAQKGDQRSLTKQHTNFLGEKAFEPLSLVKKTREASILSRSFPICQMGIIGPILSGVIRQDHGDLHLWKADAQLLCIVGVQSNLPEYELDKHGLMKRTGKQ